MASRLRDLLDGPGFAVELLVDGDLDRPIRWVHVTELADPSPYLVGEELLLTAGVWRRRGASAGDFVRALARRRAAGLGYGLLDAEERVPPALVRACREQGVPLFAVGVQTPFLAISQWFVDRLTRESEAVLRGTLRLTTDLLAAAEEEPTRAALGAVARVLARTTGREVWITDGDGRAMAWARTPPDGGAGQALAAAAAGTEEPRDVDVPGHGTWRVRPVVAGRRRAALLAVPVDGDDLLVRARTDAAAPIIGLVLTRERAVRETERRLSGEVVSLVLSRQDDLAAARLATYRLDPDRPLVVVVCRVADGEEALTQAEGWREDAGADAVLALRGAELFAILPGAAVPEADGPLAVATALARRVRAAGAGVSTSPDGVATLRRAVVQAQQSAELAQRRGGSTVLSDELRGRAAHLLALQDSGDVEDFRQTLLGRLEDHDRRHESDLGATLRAFLETGGRWQETADRLHVHVNTLRHRLARVEQLTGRRLDSTPDRVDLWLALQVPASRPAAR
jgi:PucR family transcriptional regulator, purine catabolism regulatory protein